MLSSGYMTESLTPNQSLRLPPLCPPPSLKQSQCHSGHPIWTEEESCPFSGPTLSPYLEEQVSCSLYVRHRYTILVYTYTIKSSWRAREPGAARILEDLPWSNYFPHTVLHSLHPIQVITTPFSIPLRTSGIYHIYQILGTTDLQMGKYLLWDFVKYCLNLCEHYYPW